MGRHSRAANALEAYTRHALKCPKQKSRSHSEETLADCCAALGRVAGRGAVSTAAARYERRDKQFDTHQYRRYLPRGNGCDVLQCTYRPEPEWLWFKRLCRIKRGIRLERWVWLKRARRRCRAVSSYSDLLRISPGQRIVQLINNTRGSRLGSVEASNGRAGWSRASGLDVSATAGTASAGSQCCSVLNRYRIKTRPVLTNPHRGGESPDGFLADLMNPVAVRQCFGNSF